MTPGYDQGQGPGHPGVHRQAEPRPDLLDTINYIPGVNFTQNDPYGSSGGNIRIRGFDGNRVSLTFDGVPLNDSGNYAIFPNQLLDPELVEQVNVNLGATDVDFADRFGRWRHRQLPFADPDQQAGRPAATSRSARSTSGACSAWSTPANSRRGAPRPGSRQARNTYDHWRGDGKIDKWQFNGKIYQPIGSNGDFVSIAGHYNQNRNNNYNNPNLTDLRIDLRTTSAATDSDRRRLPVVVGDYSSDQWQAINSIVFPSVCRNAAGHVVTRSPNRLAIPRPAIAPEEPGGSAEPRVGPPEAGHHQPARRADQPVEHRQHPRPVALHDHRRPRPDDRPDLPVCACQRRQPGRACRGEGQLFAGCRRSLASISMATATSIRPGRPSFDHQHQSLDRDQLAGVEDEPDEHVPRRLHLRPGAPPADRRIFVHRRQLQPRPTVLRPQRHADHY